MSSIEHADSEDLIELAAMVHPATGAR